MREKFSLRTVLIPLFAIVGFFAIQLFITIAYMAVVFIIQSFSATGFNPGNTQEITDLLMGQMNNISGIYSVIVSVVALVVIRILMKSNQHAIRIEKVSVLEGIAAGVVMIGTAGVITALMAGIAALGGIVPFIEDQMNKYTELSQSFISSGNITIVILTTCILVPIAEDLVFRGIVQGELRRVMPGWAAVVIQAVIFALVHGNLIQISYVILPAIILGALYEWSKSIYVPIFLHMLFNFTGAAIPLMLEGNDNAGQIFVMFEFSVIPLMIVALFFLYNRRKKDSLVIIKEDNLDIQDA